MKDSSTFADAIQRIELSAGGGVSEVVSFGEALRGPPSSCRAAARRTTASPQLCVRQRKGESDHVVLDAADLERGPIATVALGQACRRCSTGYGRRMYS